MQLSEMHWAWRIKKCKKHIVLLLEHFESVIVLMADDFVPSIRGVVFIFFNEKIFKLICFNQYSLMSVMLKIVENDYFLIG